MLLVSDVAELLDTSRKEYDAELTELKTLPSNAILTIKIDDTVTAEYQDKRTGIFHIFHLTYDYSSQKKELACVDVGMEFSGRDRAAELSILYNYIIFFLIGTVVGGTLLSLAMTFFLHSYIGGM